MKKLLLLLAALFSGGVAVYAQWDTVHTGSTKVMAGIDFKWRDTALVVGYDSTNNLPFIYRSLNQGASWTEISAAAGNRRAPLLHVTFSGGDSAWAVGDSASVIFSSDAGNTWVDKSDTAVTHYTHLFTVQYLNAHYGYAAGFNGKIYRMNENGPYDTVHSPTNLTIRSLFFVTPASGWITGDGGLIACTSDSGATWTFQTNQPYFGFFNGRDIYFVNGNRGWCVGRYGMLLQTTDGGANWMAAPGVNTSQDLYAVSFKNILAGVVCGNHGTILRTYDGGGTWTDESLPYQTKNYYAAAWSGDTTAFVCGAYGKMARSTVDISAVLSTAAEPLKLSAYPNPFADQFTLRFDHSLNSEASITVMDLTGKVLSASNTMIQNGSEFRIETGDWTAGVYFLRVQAGTQTAVLRVIKY